MSKFGILLILLFSFSGVVAQDNYDYIVNEIDTVQSFLEDQTIINDFIPGNDLENVSSDSIIYEITGPNFDTWEKVSLQGKLKMQGLPLSPSLKIFMQRDSVIDISVRAPFIGEAGRLTLTQDSILAVNKMNKTYVCEKFGNSLPIFLDRGILMRNIQDLLLARFFLPGIELTEENIDGMIDIYYEDDQFNIIPKGEAQIEGVRYGFVVDELFNPLMLVVIPENQQNIELDVSYTYESKGYDIDILLQEGNSKKEVILEFKEPEWKGEQTKPIDIGKKYRKLSFGEFLRSIAS